MNELPKWPHTGAILTGGQSSRMGQDKYAMTLPDGRTMFDKVMDVMSEVCSRVVVLSGDSDSIKDGIRNIPDLRLNCGPLGGIEALLSSNIDSEYLICPCDVPLISAEVLYSLIQNNSEESVSALMFSNDDAVQSLPLRINTNALTTVKQQLDEGKRAIHQLFNKIDIKEIPIQENQRPHIQNINTPKEYEDVCRLIASFQ